MRTGAEVLLEVLASEGVRHVFGNPGTTELPFMDTLAGRDDLRYVLGLQEAAVVGLADGYAQATGRPAFLNLHTAAGLGNAVGNLTNARANTTPLVVTAGQQDRRHLVADPLLSGDLTGLARGVSKWSHEVRTLGELGTILRRAFRDAAAPPTGPVFVSMPMDILDEAGEVPVPDRSTVDHRRTPPPDAVDALCRLLVEVAPGRLAIVAGDEVSVSGGVEALVATAETLGAPVYGSPLHGTTVFPTVHPLWRGPLHPMAAKVRETLADADRVLLVGGQAFLAYPYTPGPPLPDGTELLHVSSDPAQPGHTWPTRLGLVGDPRETLEALLRRLQVDPPAEAAAALAQARERREAMALRAEEHAEGAYAADPMHAEAAVHALLRALPDDTPVVDEAVTAGSYIRRLQRSDAPGRYFFCRGGGLGWGMPAAAGVSLGLDRKPVLCVVGDGSAMYSPRNWSGG
ncbi:MAG: thiamine pyrophosphate-binding protein [Streptosporangiales bacterium]